MDKIFNFAIPEIDTDFLTPSIDKIRKGNLLRVYLKELVINKITEQNIIQKYFTINQRSDAIGKLEEFLTKNKEYIETTYLTRSWTARKIH